MPALFVQTRDNVARRPTLTQYAIILAISLFLQLALALLFGHQYDVRIFMATGYLVAARQNPYIAQNLTSVFHNGAFQDMTSVGYPPPWPLVLGFIYQSTYRIVPSFLLYNLSIKLPIIAANILVAHLTVKILRNLNIADAGIWRAWSFMLLNPFILYATAAWGQIDSLVALLSLYSLVLLYDGRSSAAAILLALAISIKPSALPILPVACIYLQAKSKRRAVKYALMALTAILFFSVAPFWIFSWDPAPILRGWNAHFSVGGGMSFITFWELIADRYQLPTGWQAIGFLWLPALAIATLVTWKDGIDGFDDLVTRSVGMIFVFFLTRTWLSEPNIVLILPFLLILTSIGRLPNITLSVMWILPLIFTIFNTSPVQLLFPIAPEVMRETLSLVDNYRQFRLIARTIVVVPWLVVGWWIALACLKRDAPTQVSAWI